MTKLNSYLKELVQIVLAFLHGRFIWAGIFLAASRVFQLATFFLPIKVLIVLSSANQPHYFNYFLSYVSLDTIIAILLAAVPVSYCCYIVSGVVYRYFVDADLDRRKSTGVEINGLCVQGGLFAAMQKRAVVIFGDVLLCVLILSAIAVFHWLFMVLLLCLLIMSLLIIRHYALDATEERRVTFLKLHRRQLIEYVSSSNFLFVFFALALGSKYLHVGIFSSVLILLLARMLFQALQRFSLESIALKTAYEKAKTK